MNLSALKPRVRYSLRALLVLMTALALFCWYHLSWIHQRQIVMSARGVHALASDESFYRPAAAPGLLSMFGEEGYQAISIDVKKSQLAADQVRRLFPEANVLESFPYPDSPRSPERRE